jgi:EmrB/QacA subfamily drug resistance transporter
MSRVNIRSAPAWATLAVCCVAQFMVVLDVSIVNVALPQMRHDLGLSVTDQQWVVNAYTLTFAGFLMLGGRAADLFGRRRVFMVGLALFTAFSLIGGLAQSGEWLIAARAAQGIGGAILAPATLSLLTSKFTDPNARRKALGAWSATAASGAAVGVLLGGVLTDVLDWRWVLFVNVPIGAALLVVSGLALAESRAEGPRRRLDLPGAVSVTAGLAILVYGIVSTNVHPWGSARTVVTLAVGLALLVFFGLFEARIAKDPLVPLGVFRRRSLSAANGVAVTIGISLFGMYFFLSLYLQQVAGYSPLRGGLAFLPAGLSTLVGAVIGTRLVATIGPRRQLLLGPLMAAAGLFWMTTLAVGDSYLGHIFVPLLLVGVGLGLSFVPMTIAATTGVPAHQAGLASALINTTRQMGGAVGLAVMATVAASVASHHGAGAGAVAAALTNGYDRAFLIAAISLVIGAGVALLLPRPAPATAPATAHDTTPVPADA